MRVRMVWWQLTTMHEYMPQSLLSLSLRIKQMNEMIVILISHVIIVVIFRWLYYIYIYIFYKWTVLKGISRWYMLIISCSIKKNLTSVRELCSPYFGVKANIQKNMFFFMQITLRSSIYSDLHACIFSKSGIMSGIKVQLDGFSTYRQI